MEQANLKGFKAQVQFFNSYYFGLMITCIMVQSCVGSIAAMYALDVNSLWMLSTAAAITMGTNAVFIAQAPTKLTLAAFYTSIIVNVVLIITGISIVGI